jgi:bifunctional non-homologous end joining protein LigD
VQADLGWRDPDSNRGLEGIVAKRLDAPYEPGRRSGAWLKHKHRRRETFAVTGWRAAPARGRRLEALFLARTYPDGTTAAAGSVEIGPSTEERDRLRRALQGASHPYTRR